MERRDVVGGGLVAGIASLLAANGAEAGQGDGSVASAIESLRRTIEISQSAPWVRVEQVRAQQRAWMRTAQKFPDFIEIGIGVWEGLVDWHVRFQQPLETSRAADGRYLMSFMDTTLILRPDMDVNYVGPAFDGDRRPGQNPN
jgi:hypothetical protein